MENLKWPIIVVTASQRYTNDWDGSLSLAQARVSYQYCEAVYRTGGLPLIAASYTGEGPKHYEGRGWPQEPPRKIGPLKGRAKAIMSQAHGLLLTGGGDVILGDEDGLDSVREMDRDRDFWEAALLEAAMELDKPVFGVCRGLQLMNKLLGGTLWNDIPSEFDNPIIHQQSEPRTEKSHKVILEPNSLIKRICGSDLIEVNTGHHQAAKDVAPDLKVTGRSPDGLIEVLEHRRLKFFLGVQWHPESLVPFDRVSETLFLAFINEAAACGSQ